MAGCFDSIYNWCYNVTHTPITAKKLLIGGGIIIVIIIIIILATTIHGGSSSNDNGGGKKHLPGHDALTLSPLVLGKNSLSNFLKIKLKNKIADANLNESRNWNCTECESDFFSMGQGLVSGQIWTVGSSDCEAEHKDAVPQTMEQIDVLLRVIQKYNNNLNLVQSSDDLAASLSSRKLGTFLCIDGSHNLDGRPAVLRMFARLGVKCISLLSSDCTTEWATQVDAVKNDTSDNGLNQDFGKKMVKEMNRLGMLIDLTYASNKTRFDVMSISTAPVIFSKTNAWDLVNHKLNLDNRTLDMVKVNKGLVMVSFHLDQVAKPDDKNVNLTNLINHLNFLKKRVGIESVGIGGGFDDGGGIMLVNLTSPSNVTNFFDVLGATPGWTMDDLRKIAGDNFIRVLKAVKQASQKTTEKPLEEYQAKKDFRDGKVPECYSDGDIRFDADPKKPDPKPSENDDNKDKTNNKTNTDDNPKPAENKDKANNTTNTDATPKPNQKESLIVRPLK